MENLKRVRDMYFEVITLLKEQEHLVILDGTQSIDAIAEDVWEEVRRL